MFVCEPWFDCEDVAGEEEQRGDHFEEVLSVFGDESDVFGTDSQTNSHVRPTYHLWGGDDDGIKRFCESSLN